MKLTPVLCGTSYRNKGVQPLLDAVVDYLPSPLDIPPVTGMSMDGDQEIVRHPNDEEPFSALAFKIMVDPFVGKLAFFRAKRCGSRLVYVQLHQEKRESACRILLTRQPPRRRTVSTRATSPRSWA